MGQLAYLGQDIRRIVNRRWWRWFGCWFSPSASAVIAYRVDRTLSLMCGNVWVAARVILAPVGWLLRPWLGRCEIAYSADIGPGLNILHPGLGLVIGAPVTAGRNLTLTGGNCLGTRGGSKPGEVRIGDNVTVGANATILGPIAIGNHVMIGAGAVVVHDTPDDAVVRGVPGKPGGQAPG